jgi:hypothetical protein
MISSGLKRGATANGLVQRAGTGLLAVLLSTVVLASYGASLWGSPAFGRLADQPVYLALLDDYIRALSDGEWIPRWAPSANGGRGSPAFVLYPPLFFGATSFLSSLLGVTGSVEQMRWGVLIWTFLTGASIYFLARAWLSPVRSLIAGATVLLLPGTTFPCLARGMYPQFFALFWIALLIGAGLRILDGNRRGRNAAILCLAGGGLVLTHTISAYLVLYLLLFTAPALWRILGTRQFVAMVSLGVAVCLLTSWFWIPQVHGVSYTRADFLRERHPYLESIFFADAAAATEYAKDWEFINWVGRVIAIAQFLLALSLTLVKQAQDRVSGELFLGTVPRCAVFSVLAGLPPVAALLVWLPGYGMVQFFWRWQILLSLWLGVALAAVPRKLDAGLPVITAAVVIILFSPLLLPASVEPLQDLSILKRTVDEQTLQSMPPQKRALYLGSLPEHRPRGSDKLYYLPGEPGRVEVASGDGRVLEKRVRASQREYWIESRTESRLRILTYHCPGWIAELDGQEAGIERECESGLQLLRLPSGSHHLKLTFRPQWPRWGWRKTGTQIESPGDLSCANATDP